MPLYRSPIIISSIVTIRYMIVATPTNLYQNGSSFQYSICVDNPPYNTLDISITLNNTCTIDGDILPITLLDVCTTYQIICPISAQSGLALISYDNNQNDIYTFLNSSVQTTVIPYSSAIPTITSMSIVGNTRTTATIAINSSDTMKVYYALGDCGYDTVPFLDVY
jgi:hypothetical protein